MKDLKQIKALAEKMFTLSAELLRLVDIDETEQRLFMEEVKKMPTVKFFTSQSQNKITVIR